MIHWLGDQRMCGSRRGNSECAAVMAMSVMAGASTVVAAVAIAMIVRVHVIGAGCDGLIATNGKLDGGRRNKGANSKDGQKAPQPPP